MCAGAGAPSGPAVVTSRHQAAPSWGRTSCRGTGLPGSRLSGRSPSLPLSLPAVNLPLLSLPRPPSLQPAPTLSLAMAAEPGDITALVQRLRSSRAAEQLAAAKELGRLAAALPENKAALVAAGGAAALVQLLGSGRRPVQEAACQALAALAYEFSDGTAAAAAVAMT